MTAAIPLIRNRFPALERPGGRGKPWEQKRLYSGRGWRGKRRLYSGRGWRWKKRGFIYSGRGWRRKKRGFIAAAAGGVTNAVL
jgi:hypothetical protein